MNPSGFVSKQQYQAVHDHFREIVTKAEAEGNLLYVEFNLLLEYFRTVYSDSERKSKKILQLTSKISMNETLLNELSTDKAKETELLSRQVHDTKMKIDEWVQKEHALLKRVEHMSAVIRKLREEDYDERDEDEEKSFREFGIVTGEELSWQPCETCAKKSRETLLKEMADRERDDDVIQEMTTKINALVTELEMAYKERDELQSTIQRYSQLLEESKNELARDDRTRRELDACASEKKSMQVSIDKLVQELYAKKSQVRGLQDELEKEKSKWGAIVLECKSKDKHLEEAEEALKAAKGDKEAAVRKAGFFERSLATDRQHREAVQEEMIRLRAEAEELKNQLRDFEGQQRALVAQLRTEFRKEFMEQNQKFVNCKTEMANKNKEIESLLNKLSETEKQLGLLKIQAKSKSSSASAAELERVKAELRDLNSAHRTTQCQLETFRTAFENQKTKIDCMKRANEALLKEKNKFICQSQHLEIKLKTQKKHAELILYERDCQRKVLRAIDNQAEKLAKKKRGSGTGFRY